MFLTQNQAYITLCEFTNLSYREVDKELANLRSHSSGQYAICLKTTGNKIRFDTEFQLFYLDSYHYSEHDNLYIYDFLDLLDDYWDMKECEIESSEQPTEEIARQKLALEFKKICYQCYKKSIEYQVA